MFTSEFSERVYQLENPQTSTKETPAAFWMLGRETEDQIFVRFLQVQPRRAGIGTALVEDLKDYADKTGKTLVFELVIPTTRPLADRFDFLESRPHPGEPFPDYIYTPVAAGVSGLGAVASLDHELAVADEQG